MPDSILGPVFDADACASRISADPWSGVATYVLWDRLSGEPVYCGTAASRGRLKSHLKKNDPSLQPSLHNLRNPDLTALWQSKKSGWLGISFRVFSSEAEAKTVEQQIIAAYGIRKFGGKLYNQRLSG